MRMAQGWANSKGDGMIEDEHKLKFFSLDKHLDFDTVVEMNKINKGGVMSTDEAKEFMQRFLKRLSYTKLLSQLDCVREYDISTVDSITAHDILISAMNYELTLRKENILIISY